MPETINYAATEFTLTGAYDSRVGLGQICVSPPVPALESQLKQAVKQALPSQSKIKFFVDTESTPQETLVTAQIEAISIGGKLVALMNGQVVAGKVQSGVTSCLHRAGAKAVHAQKLRDLNA